MISDTKQAKQIIFNCYMRHSNQISQSPRKVWKLKEICKASERV